MHDRFDRTRREAKAAIARAKARETTARGRRREIELRIAELDGPHTHRPAAERKHLEEARERAARAEESSERARRRADEAEARRGTR